MAIAYQDARILVAGLDATRVAALRGFAAQNGFRDVRGCAGRDAALLAAATDDPDIVLVCVTPDDPASRKFMDDVAALKKEHYVAVIAVGPNFDRDDLIERLKTLPAMRLLYREFDEEKARFESESQSRAVQQETAIAALKAAEQTLTSALADSEDNSRAKSEFIANLSHEFRTPLNAIIGFSEILRDETFGPHGSPKYKEYSADILGAARHLLALVDDVLEISRAEAGQLDIKLEPVDVRDTINAAVRMLHDKAKAKGITLRVDVAPDFPHLQTDERRLRQVLLNVVGNAVKFTPPSGSVAVKAGVDPEDGAFIIVVSDTGVGIDPADLPRVMSRYGQIKSDQPAEDSGSGLGLPLTRRIVEALGGNLEIHSRRGVGTAVKLHFPPELIVGNGHTAKPPIAKTG